MPYRVLSVNFLLTRHSSSPPRPDAISARVQSLAALVALFLHSEPKVEWETSSGVVFRVSLGVSIDVDALKEFVMLFREQAGRSGFDSFAEVTTSDALAPIIRMPPLDP